MYKINHYLGIFHVLQDQRFDSSNKGKKNKIFEHLKKEIEIRNKRVPTKEEVKNQVFFVDKVKLMIN